MYYVSAEGSVSGDDEAMGMCIIEANRDEGSRGNWKEKAGKASCWLRASYSAYRRLLEEGIVSVRTSSADC